MVRSVLWLLAGCDPKEATTTSGASADTGTPPPDTTTDTPLPTDTAPTTTPPEWFAELDREVWSYLPVDGMICGGGTDTGIGVNPGSDPSKLVFLVAGGGLCFDNETCFVQREAANVVGGWGPVELAIDTAGLETAPFFDRTDPTNPWGDATWIEIPYCTGDLHIGDSVQKFADGTMHFAGDTNFAAALAAVAAELPDVASLWVYGPSAGGFGAQLQADRFADTWSGADLALLADSAPMVDPDPATLGAWGSAWNPRLPPSCASCGGFTEALAAQIQTLSDARFGLVETWDDAVAEYFLDLTLRPALADLLIDVYSTEDRAQAFVLDGTEHVQLTKPYRVGANGVTIADWATSWRDGDAGFVDDYVLP